MFVNREDAGHQLAEQLKEIELRDPLVLAIPRGGVPVGAALAHDLGAELDVVLSRKLRAPTQHELALGAIGEDGHVYLNPLARGYPGLTPGYLQEEQQHQLAEIARRQKLFRGARSSASVKNRSVIVTDDGIATGSTMIAALEAVRHQQPRELIVAVPVAPPRQLGQVRSLCDRLICLKTPEEFWAVGQFYVDFTQVEDDEVVEMLRKFASSKQSSQPVG